MKVTPGTLLATMMGTAGALIGPALLGSATAIATPAVHLMTSIQTLARAPEGTRYAVSVRSVGGTAHTATLVLTTFGPAAWTAAAPGCLSSADHTALACELGDLSPQRARTLRVTARPGPGGSTQVPVIAQASAVDAPPVVASLGVAHPAALRMVRHVGEPVPSSSPGTEAAQEPQTFPAPEVSGPAGASPEPSPSFSAAPAVPVSPEAQTPWSAAAEPPRRVRPARPARKPAPRPAHPPAASATPSPAAAPQAGTTPEAGAPAVPQVSVGPDASATPAAPAAVPPAAIPPLGGPALPLPTIGASPATPSIAPRTSRDGVSQLDTLSPAGAMQAGRTSWATLVAIAVVTEAGLLWLVAGLTVMRRRRVGPASRRPGRLSSMPLLSRIRP